MLSALAVATAIVAPFLLLLRFWRPQLTEQSEAGMSRAELPVDSLSITLLPPAANAMETLQPVGIDSLGVTPVL
jgi:hypothetical protein